MTPISIQYRKLRAPAEHGEALIDPALSDSPQLLQQNVAIDRSRMMLGERSVDDWATELRAFVLERATAWTSAYRSTSFVDDRSPDRFIVSGHQPLLYHPGVWFKNFVLSSIARRCGAVPICLIIDNDTLTHASIRVPTGALAEPTIANIAIDQATDVMPVEERTVESESDFAQFGDRVRNAIAPFTTDPLIDPLWRYATEAISRHRTLGYRLAEARHRLEADYGAETLEVPLSQVCESAPFYHFVAHLAEHAVRFREVHNRRLREYRTVHRIRSRAHPVPDLISENAWHELPLWTWSDANPQRRRLFAMANKHGVAFSDREAWRWPNSGVAEFASVVDGLHQATREGIKLRPRALLTTMFARLFLSDLFIHGIGGAKYDQLTDAIIAEFFSTTPPGFITISATAQLSVSNTLEWTERCRELNDQIRRLIYHPERSKNVDKTAVIAGKTVAQWSAEKQKMDRYQSAFRKPQDAA